MSDEANKPSRELPRDVEAEAQLLCCYAKDAGATLKAALAAGITESSFYELNHRLYHRAFTKLEREHSPTFEAWAIHQALKESGDLDAVGGLPAINTLTDLVPSTLFANRLIDTVRNFEIKRTLARLGDRLAEQARNGVALDDLIVQYQEGARAFKSQVQKTSEADLKIRERLESRRFNHAVIPREPPPRFSINGHAACTPGNLTNIIAQSKTGKSAFIGAGIASAIAASIGVQDRDTLGFGAAPPGQSFLIHIDTEQSRTDHDKLIRLALRRAGMDEMPTWLWSYGCAGFTSTELRQTLSLLLADAKGSGGVFAVILDGVADFVNDVNDPAETNPFVAELQSMAIDHDCPIINVIHENPGQDFGKGRGHLGSQLERKAESNLRLKKSDEVTVVFSERQRRSPILEKDGPRFSWDNQAAMHLSCKSAAGNDGPKRAKLRDSAEAILQHAGKDRVRYSEFLKAATEVLGIGRDRAESRFTEMKKFGVLSKDIIGSWGLSDP